MRNATEMTVTNKRVFGEGGVFAARRTDRVAAFSESGEHTGVAGKRDGENALGYGTVIVHGTGGTPEVFNRIAHPLEFRTQVQQQIEKSQGSSR